MSKKIEDMEFEKYSDGRIINNYTNRQKMKELLDDKGKGFCLAKWTQVTMHLGNGLTHSCHHPTAHKIPVDELKNNPGALHNTKFKKKNAKKCSTVSDHLSVIFVGVLRIIQGTLVIVCTRV
jgi:hypothetical protein